MSLMTWHILLQSMFVFDLGIIYGNMLVGVFYGLFFR